MENSSFVWHQDSVNNVITNDLRRVIDMMGLSPDEFSVERRKGLEAPQLRLLSTEEGTICEVNVDNRLRIILEPYSVMLPSIYTQDEATQAFRVAHIYARHKNGGKQEIDLLEVLHENEKQWGVEKPTHVYFTFSHVVAHFESDGQYILFPFALGRRGQRLCIDPERTIAQFLHEAGHAMRSKFDSDHELDTLAMEQGANETALQLVENMSEYISSGDYKRFTKISEGSYK